MDFRRNWLEGFRNPSDQVRFEHIGSWNEGRANLFIMKTKTKAIAIIFAAMLMAGCASTVSQVAVQSAIQITDPNKVKAIAITKVAAKIRRGTDIGDLRSGGFCVKHDDIKWRTGNKVNLSSEDLVDVFREELEANGWPVVGSTENLFEGYDVSGAEVLVAARITEIDTSMCAPSAGFGNWDLKGSMRMDVEWQVYSPAARSLIGKIDTQGSSILKEKSDDAAWELLSDSFGLAVNNLLADPKFLNMVERSSGLAQAPTSDAGRLINNKRNNYQTITAALGHAKLATVTIRVAQGHGSGFAVGDGNYVLTNSHVVGNAKNVTLVTKDGVSVNGRVELVSKDRDVALVAINNIRLPTLHVNSSVPKSGEQVYAVGSPLDEELNSTVTSGIVSGTRLLEGYNWIQSDTAISPGNSGGPLLDKNGSVVGISTAGYQMGQAQVGLNLFIPIADALAFVGLRVE